MLFRIQKQPLVSTNYIQLQRLILFKLLLRVFIKELVYQNKITHMSNRKFLFSSVQILTTFALCLLFIQTVRYTPFPLDGLAQKKEDFVYRDSDQVGGGIEESKTLCRDISPNDHRDGSRKNSLNRFHHRVTRDTHSCVKSNISVTICGGMMVFNVCHLWEYKRRFDWRVLPSARLRRNTDTEVL